MNTKFKLITRRIVELYEDEKASRVPVAKESTNNGFVSWLKRERPGQSEAQVLSYIKWIELYITGKVIVNQQDPNEVQRLIDSLNNKKSQRSSNNSVLDRAINSLRLYHKYLLECKEPLFKNQDITHQSRSVSEFVHKAINDNNDNSSGFIKSVGNELFTNNPRNDTNEKTKLNKIEPTLYHAEKAQDKVIPFPQKYNDIAESSKEIGAPDDARLQTNNKPDHAGENQRVNLVLHNAENKITSGFTSSVEQAPRDSAPFKVHDNKLIAALLKSSAGCEYSVRVPDRAELSEDVASWPHRDKSWALCEWALILQLYLENINLSPAQVDGKIKAFSVFLREAANKAGMHLSPAYRSYDEINLQYKRAEFVIRTSQKDVPRFIRSFARVYELFGKDREHYDFLLEGIKSRIAETLSSDSALSRDVPTVINVLKVQEPQGMPKPVNQTRDFPTIQEIDADIASWPRQDKVWTWGEWALLLELYFSCKDKGYAERRKAINELSLFLRKSAKEAGLST